MHRRVVTIKLNEGQDTVEHAENAVLAQTALSDGAANLFGLFVSVNGGDPEETTLPSRDGFG